ncbi:MAG TPA: hypothetical protein VK943_12095 [Arenibaculum sp.]|nr:hypothetical protein [Arenibaculum sp.]
MAKEHKKVRVRDADGDLKEITEFPDTVISNNLMTKSKMTRFYFLTSEDRQAAECIRAMKKRTSTVLELAATIHWLCEKERVEDWCKELKIRKPSKADDERIDQALELLRELKLAA